MFNEENYSNEYGNLEFLKNGFDLSKYSRVLYCVNDYMDDEEKNIESQKNQVIIPKGTKVKCVHTNGWWHIVFESEDGTEAYVIYYTPAGVT